MFHSHNFNLAGCIGRLLELNRAQKIVLHCKTGILYSNILQMYLSESYPMCWLSLFDRLMMTSVQTFEHSVFHYAMVEYALALLVPHCGVSPIQKGKLTTNSLSI